MKQKICPTCDGRLNGKYCPVCRKFVKKPLEWDTDYYLNEGQAKATVRSDIPANKERTLGKPAQRRSKGGLILLLIIFVWAGQTLAGIYLWPAIRDAVMPVFTSRSQKETEVEASWEDIFETEALLSEESEKEQIFEYSEEFITDEEAIASGKRCDGRHFSVTVEELEPELQIYLVEKGLFVDDEDEVSVNQVYQYSNLPFARAYTDYRTTKAWYFEEPGREEEEYYSSLMIEYDTVTHEVHNIKGYFYEEENAKESLEWGMNQVATLLEPSPEEKEEKTAEQLFSEFESNGGFLYSSYPAYNVVMQTDSDGMIVFWMEPSIKGDNKEKQDSEEPEEIFEAQSVPERNYMKY
mgnify:FL=1